MGDNDRRTQIIVHRLVTTFANGFHIDRGNFGRLDLREVVPPFEHTLQGLFRCLQGLVAEIDRAAIMRLQDKEAYRHRRIRLLQQFVITGEELVERNEVTQRFAHLLPVDGNHIVMHPIVHRLVPLRSHRLGYLAFVVGEKQIHASAVNVEFLAQVLGAHGRTFEMPAGKTVAPRRGPPHDMFGRSLFPKSEIETIVLLALSVELPRRVEQVVDIAPRQFAVMVIFIILHYIEVNRPVTYISISGLYNLFDIFDLFDNMPRRMRLDTRRQHVKSFHRFVITVQIILYHLHRFERFEPCFFGNLILPFVGIVFQMPYIGNIAHIAHFISQMP